MDNLKEIIETTGKAESILSDTKFLKNMVDRNICFFKCERCGGMQILRSREVRVSQGSIITFFARKQQVVGGLYPINQYVQPQMRTYQYK